MHRQWSVKVAQLLPQQCNVCDTHCRAMQQLCSHKPAASTAAITYPLFWRVLSPLFSLLSIIIFLILWVSSLPLQALNTVVVSHTQGGEKNKNNKKRELTPLSFSDHPRDSGIYPELHSSTTQELWVYSAVFSSPGCYWAVSIPVAETTYFTFLAMWWLCCFCTVCVSNISQEFAVCTVTSI